MRIAPSLLIAATFASTLTAQRPRALRADQVGAAGAPILQSVTVDLAGAAQERYRATAEALVFGRFSIGLSGAYTTHAYLPSQWSPMPVYRAWSFDLHGRWYPSRLSFDGERKSASVYIGEFIGYHERRIDEGVLTLGGCCGLDTLVCTSNCSGRLPGPVCNVCAISVTSAQVNPSSPSSVTRKLHGWEPGAELGIRIMASRHVVIDAGGALREETLQDPRSGVRPGGLVKQLTVAMGVGW